MIAILLLFGFVNILVAQPEVHSCGSGIYAVAVYTAKTYFIPEDIIKAVDNRINGQPNESEFSDQQLDTYTWFREEGSRTCPHFWNCPLPCDQVMRTDCIPIMDSTELKKRDQAAGNVDFCVHYDYSYSPVMAWF